MFDEVKFWVAHEYETFDQRDEYKNYIFCWADDCFQIIVVRKRVNSIEIILTVCDKYWLSIQFSYLQVKFYIRGFIDLYDI